VKGFGFIKTLASLASLRQGDSVPAGNATGPFRSLAGIIDIIREKLRAFTLHQRQTAMVFSTLGDLGLSVFFIHSFYARYRESLSRECTPALIRQYYREYLELLESMRINCSRYGKYNFGKGNLSAIRDMSELIEFEADMLTLSGYELSGFPHDSYELSSRQLSYAEYYTIIKDCLSYVELLFLLVYLEIASLYLHLLALAAKLRKYRFSFSRQLSFAMITGRPSLANSPPFVPGI